MPAVVAALAVLVGGCSSGGTHSAASTSSRPTTSPTSASTSSTSGSTSPTAGGTPPVRARGPAHVVVVIEENKSAGQALDAGEAPYIASLAQSGALFSQSYAVTHPSEPNYLALFSGSTHDVSGDPCPPPGSPFDSPNLATALSGGGLTFASFAEDLPAEGSLACTSGAYARKHNPASDFSNVASPANRPFTDFPSDFDRLPTISFVVPNLDHDMHDGTIQQGDQWLQAHLGSYVRWAASHDSLLVLTWDEDDESAGNHILTVVVGQGVRARVWSQRIDHYGVLATLCALYGVPAPGQAATAAPVVGLWSAGGG
jgi:acid phosphatase